MNRRGYLRTLGATTAATAGLAGCLGDANPNTNLGKPEREHNMTSKQLPYLAWGERIPAVTIEDPLTGQKISIRDDVETPSLFTFIFTHCMDGVCPALISALSNVQTHSITNDYADDVTFLPITFDPARDDAEALRSFAKKLHVNLSAGNWHFLRPSSKKRAQTIVEEKFGVVFKRTASMPGMNHDGYMFIHTALTLLVNADGYVERAYRTKSPNPDKIIEDLKKLR